MAAGPGSMCRTVLAKTILPHLPNLRLDELSEDSLAYLLNRDNDRHFHYHARILTNIATEAFVTERLLPLMKGARGKYLSELKAMMVQMGYRYGRRYHYAS